MKKLTNIIIDNRLKNRNIKRIDNYLGNKTPINFKCNICKYIWKSKPDNIINSGKGCPNCAGNAKLTNEIIDNRLFNKKIRRLEDYVGPNYFDLNWQCLKAECLYIWSARPANLLLENRGCPKCSNRVKLTNKIIDKRLEDRKIIRIGECINSQTNIEWKCLDCNTIWNAPPNRVVNTGTGCPVCFNSAGEKIIYDFLRKNNIFFEYQKDIRILNSNENRYCRVDFYIPSYNIIIEYNGGQHYEPIAYFSGGDKELAKLKLISQQQRDEYIKIFCLNNKIQLVTIDGRKLRNNKLITLLHENIGLKNEII